MQGEDELAFGRVTDVMFRRLGDGASSGVELGRVDIDLRVKRAGSVVLRVDRI